MKTILSFLAVILIFSSCHPIGPGKKGVDHIESIVKNSLDCPETYKSISTRIDPAMSDDIEVIFAIKKSNFYKEFYELEQIINKRPLTSAELDSLKRVLKKYKGEECDICHNKEAIGWKAQNNYKAQDCDGREYYKTAVLILNPDMSELLAFYHIDDSFADEMHSLKKIFNIN